MLHNRLFGTIFSILDSCVVGNTSTISLSDLIDGEFFVLEAPAHWRDSLMSLSLKSLELWYRTSSAVIPFAFWALTCTKFYDLHKICKQQSSQKLMEPSGRSDYLITRSLECISPWTQHCTRPIAIIGSGRQRSPDSGSLTNNPNFGGKRSPHER